jgi:hypothetical protein
VALECQGSCKHLSDELENATTDQCTLTGIIAAVHLIQEPCALTIVTPARVSFGNFSRLRGNNKELKGLLIRLIRAKKCCARAVVWSDEDVPLRSKLKEIEQRAVRVTPVDVAAHYGVPRATQLTFFGSN